MSTHYGTTDRTAAELTCPIPGCFYSHRSASGSIGYVGGSRAGGWEATDDDASAGWREEYTVLACPTSIEPEYAAATKREDCPERYCEKHRMGVTS